MSQLIDVDAYLWPVVADPTRLPADVRDAFQRARIPLRVMAGSTWTGMDRLQAHPIIDAPGHVMQLSLFLVEDGIECLKRCGIPDALAQAGISFVLSDSFGSPPGVIFWQPGQDRPREHACGDPGEPTLSALEFAELTDGLDPAQALARVRAVYQAVPKVPAFYERREALAF
jgi:hypothetical protein